ncbi:hypothetical protein BRD17_07450 [Halobacteriales archaeon SW_7_68_16]|nr:MAG: hypothetical protein BRD17_07450 [Halobacteriales archaeon SW_7_68_16]
MATDHDERAELLAERTVLKQREAEVQALKEAGRTHAEIAETLDLSKSTIDEYSRRINDRLVRAEATLDEIEQ